MEDIRVYDCGRISGFKGATKKDNPFKRNTKTYKEWEAGRSSVDK